MMMNNVSRRRFLKATLAGPAMLAAGILPVASAEVKAPYRAFHERSEWNKVIPPDAPVDPDSEKFIAHLKSFNPAIQGPRLAAGKWSEPIYWAKTGDPWYAIPGFPVPKVRVPAGARHNDNSDSEMTIYDLEMGWVIKFTKASFDGTTWHTQAKEWYSLTSNGLDGRLPESDEKRNVGHRGYPPPLHAVRWDEIQAGEIRHTLKVALDKTGPAHVYPGCGHEANRGGIIPEGAVLRIKPSIDLGRVPGLGGAALVIARAMQRYGVVVGDTGGTPLALKLEGLEAEGRKERWSQVRLSATALSALSFDDFECIKLGYHRP